MLTMHEFVIRSHKKILWKNCQWKYYAVHCPNGNLSLAGYQTPEYTTNPSIPTTPDGNQPPFNHQQSFGSQGQPDYYGTQQTDY